MSKYHKLLAAVAKRDWTTTESIAAGLRSELKLKGYGTEFQVWRDGVSIDAAAVRQAIISSITARPVMGEYQRSIQETILEDGEEFFDSYEVTVEAEPPELMFEHGGFRHPMNLGELEVVVGAKNVERRRNRRTKKEIEKEDKAQSLKEKLDATQDTDETDYLVHANQCGYLVKNTSIRFFAQIEGQLGCSTETKIQGIALPKLQEFIDSTGSPTLSEVSTHVDTSLVKTKSSENGKGVRVQAVHSDFAKEIVDFINLEYEVDIDDIKRQHRQEKADSGFQSIEYWIEQSGGDRASVLERLLERRRDMDPADITEAFELGYGSKLL